MLLVGNCAFGADIACTGGMGGTNRCFDAVTVLAGNACCDVGRGALDVPLADVVRCTRACDKVVDWVR